jgi:hypothetical protein
MASDAADAATMATPEPTTTTARSRKTGPAATESRCEPGSILQRTVSSRGGQGAEIAVQTKACTNVQLSSSGNLARGTAARMLRPSYNLGSDSRRPL